MLQRGISEEDAISMIVERFLQRRFLGTTAGFALEAQKLLAIGLEHSDRLMMKENPW